MIEKRYIKCKYSSDSLEKKKKNPIIQNIQNLLTMLSSKTTLEICFKKRKQTMIIIIIFTFNLMSVFHTCMGWAVSIKDFEAFLHSNLLLRGEQLPVPYPHSPKAL